MSKQGPKNKKAMCYKCFLKLNHKILRKLKLYIEIKVTSWTKLYILDGFLNKK